MNDLVMYLYGITTGMAMVGILLYAKHAIIKTLEHGWAGSPPTTTTALKARINNTNKPY